MTSLLQKCVVLGSRANSEKLSDWARKELRGYTPSDGDLPEYRRVRALIALDAALGFGGQVKNQQISSWDLPEFARDTITEEVRLYDGIGDLEQLAESVEDYLKFALPGSGDLIKYMNAQMNDPYRAITRLYWVVSRSAIRGVVEQVRTSLAELVGELRALMPDDVKDPSKDAADQAVMFVVSGKRNRVTVVSSQSSSGVESRAEARGAEPESETWWQRWRKRGLIIGAATVISGVAAVATWLDWIPW